MKKQAETVVVEMKASSINGSWNRFSSVRNITFSILILDLTKSLSENTKSVLQIVVCQEHFEATAQVQRENQQQAWPFCSKTQREAPFTQTPRHTARAQRLRRRGVQSSVRIRTGAIRAGPKVFSNRQRTELQKRGRDAIGSCLNS